MSHPPLDPSFVGLLITPTPIVGAPISAPTENPPRLEWLIEAVTKNYLLILNWAGRLFFSLGMVYVIYAVWRNIIG